MVFPWNVRKWEDQSQQMQRWHLRKLPCKQRNLACQSWKSKRRRLRRSKESRRWWWSQQESRWVCIWKEEWGREALRGRPSTLWCWKLLFDIRPRSSQLILRTNRWLRSKKSSNRSRSWLLMLPSLYFRRFGSLSLLQMIFRSLQLPVFLK